MIDFTSSVDKDAHRKLAVDLFNFTWDYIEKPNRTNMDDSTMIHAAHASRFHWGIAGTPLNLARGEWQISRVYSVVGRFEPALYHARESLKLCMEHHFGEFDLGFAYEAMARAYATRGDVTERDKYIEFARQSAEGVSKEGDKNWLLKNIDTVRSLSLPQWE